MSQTVMAALLLPQPFLRSRSVSHLHHSVNLRISKNLRSRSPVFPKPCRRPPESESLEVGPRNRDFQKLPIILAQLVHTRIDNHLGTTIPSYN